MLKHQDLLDYYVEKYNRSEFIENDPVSIPHQFKIIQDIEIAGLWTAVLSWGNRKSIIQKANTIMQLMDNSPYQFILHHSETERARFSNFCHRTFNYTDSLYFLSFFQNYYQNNSSLETAFTPNLHQSSSNLSVHLEHFHKIFFSLEFVPQRTRKHVSRPSRNSRCKRLIMFLRWMVRCDDKGVDFGLWKNIKPSQLMIPLDVHVERSARNLELLKRKPLDWKAVIELTDSCKKYNVQDPAIYDYALFGLSLENKINFSSTK